MRRIPPLSHSPLLLRLHSSLLASLATALTLTILTIPSQSKLAPFFIGPPFFSQLLSLFVLFVLAPAPPYPTVGHCVPPLIICISDIVLSTCITLPIVYAITQISLPHVRYVLPPLSATVCSFLVWSPLFKVDTLAMAMYILPALTTFGERDTPWYQPFGFAAAAASGCFAAGLVVLAPSLVSFRFETSGRARGVEGRTLRCLVARALEGLRGGKAHNDTMALALRIMIDESRRKVRVQESATKVEGVLCPCRGGGGEEEEVGGGEVEDELLWGALTFEAEEATDPSCATAAAASSSPPGRRDGLISALLLNLRFGGPSSADGDGSSVVDELSAFAPLTAADACLSAYAHRRVASRSRPSSPTSTTFWGVILRPVAPSAVLGGLTRKALKPVAKIWVSTFVATLFVAVPKLEELSEGQAYLVALNVAILFQARLDTGSWEKSKQRVTGNGVALIFALFVFDWLQVTSSGGLVGCLTAWCWFVYFFFRSTRQPYVTANAVYTASIALLGAGVEDEGRLFEALITTRIVLVMFGAVITVIVELAASPVWSSDMIEKCTIDFLGDLAEEVGGEGGRVKAMEQGSAFVDTNMAHALQEPMLWGRDGRRFDGDMVGKIAEAQRKIVRYSRLVENVEGGEGGKEAGERLRTALKGAEGMLRRWRVDGKKPQHNTVFLSEMAKLRELRVVSKELARQLHEMTDATGWGANERLNLACLGRVAVAAGDIAVAWGRILSMQYNVQLN